MKVIDLTGQRFGRLVVLGRAENKNSGQARWGCQCDCGKGVIVEGGALRKIKPTSSCGCLIRDRAKETMAVLRQQKREEFETELMGKKFTFAVVVSNAGLDKQGRSMWNARCDCGKAFVTRGSELVYGRVKSCGCWRAESRKKEKGSSARHNFLLTYQLSAQKRKYEWGLTDEEFFLVTQQVCHYCGLPPSLRKDTKRYNGGLMCNGIDRKDNSKGYFPDNIVPACKVCNYAKCTMTYEEYTEFLTRAGKFQLQQSTVG